MDPEQPLDNYMKSVANRYVMVFNRPLVWRSYTDFVFEVQASLKATNILDSRTVN